MMSENELNALVRRFVYSDMSQRVSALVNELRHHRFQVLTWNPGVEHVGEVATVEQLPNVGPPSSRNAYWPFHFKWGDRIRWFDIPFTGKQTEWNGFFTPASTYRPTDTLKNAMWCEYRADPEGPLVPVNHRLGTIGNKQKEHETLLDEGVEVLLNFYQPEGESLSISRQYSRAFISSIRMPGQDVVHFSTLDQQLVFLRGLATESGPDASKGKVSGENQHHQLVLKKLKAHCYSVKQEHGPFAGKFAFETYKLVARELSA